MLFIMPLCVIFINRYSSYVSIFAINPLYDNSSSASGVVSMTQSLRQLPVYHMCMADLKHPIEWLGVTIITGREHHSDAEHIEHLELGKRRKDIHSVG